MIRDTNKLTVFGWQVDITSLSFNSEQYLVSEFNVVNSVEVVVHGLLALFALVEEVVLRVFIESNGCHFVRSSRNSLCLFVRLSSHRIVGHDHSTIELVAYSILTELVTDSVINDTQARLERHEL